MYLCGSTKMNFKKGCCRLVYNAFKSIFPKLLTDIWDFRIKQMKSDSSYLSTPCILGAYFSSWHLEEAQWIFME